MKRRGLKLGVFFHPTGHHVASWRHPNAQADAAVNFDHYIEISQTAERGLFDFLFIADNVAVRKASPAAISRSAQYIAGFEPITLLSALSTATKNIGLVGTASTSYNHPYHIARKFSSLDHISHGRAGWNVVTSASEEEARNFGLDATPEHGARYERAVEFVECVKALWDSWADDAFIRDKASGIFSDPAKVRPLDHAGRHFNIAGPLNSQRPPQGHPVLVQAGASDDGRAFAARFAEVIFSNHITLSDAQAYYTAVRDLVAREGRERDSVRIMPGLSPIVGRTQREAEELNEYLLSLIDPLVGLEFLTMLLGSDMRGYPLDGPLPDLPMPKDGIQSTFINWTSLARRENLTIRQLIARAVFARGKSSIVGTPSSIADHIETWFNESAADGFNIMPPFLPGSLDDFVNLVIPELQERGIFRTAYEGATLREHLGLERPERVEQGELHESVAVHG